jgi:hypothetical protein
VVGELGFVELEAWLDFDSGFGFGSGFDFGVERFDS